MRLLWDMLYGVDAKLQPQRQMVEAEEVSADGMTGTFRLRSSLSFHDGEWVAARDAVASINRCAAREPMGQMLKARENELAAVDDRTFRWPLKTPFGVTVDYVAADWGTIVARRMQKKEPKSGGWHTPRPRERIASIRPTSSCARPARWR